MIRLVATDLDGTLVRSDGTISDRTVAAVQAAERAGLAVVFVTGRPPRWMTEVARRTGHTGIAICANGALVYDLHTGRVVEEHTMSVAVAQDLVRRLQTALFAQQLSAKAQFEEMRRRALPGAAGPATPLGAPGQVGPTGQYL